MNLSRSSSSRTELLRVFLAAADTVSFREAATRLSVSPQVVSRAVQQLEAELGEPLFHRSTRRVQITSYGERLAQAAREALDNLDRLFISDRQSPVEYAGTVRMTVPGTIGRRFVMPALAGCLQRHPGIRIDLRVSELLEDVVDAQIDVGVRIGMRATNGFVARSVARVPFYVVATPECVERNGGPPADLAALKLKPSTVLIDRNTGRPWPWFFAGGTQYVPAHPALVTDDPDAECSAVLAGLAYGQLPGFLAAPYLQSGQLQAVLVDEAPEPWHIHIYRPQRAPVPGRVRAVFDALVERLGDPGFLLR